VAATDNIAQQTASAKRTWSQAARDAVQEKIKDMMNVAHVSPLCSKVVSEVHGPKNYQIGKLVETIAFRSWRVFLETQCISA